MIKIKETINLFDNWKLLFSEFTRHISPAFNHERPERSVQMRLYTMHKGQHLLIFIMFLCLFLIALLMGMAGPRIIAEHVEKATTLKNPQQNNKTGTVQSRCKFFLCKYLYLNFVAILSSSVIISYFCVKVLHFFLVVHF